MNQGIIERIKSASSQEERKSLFTEALSYKFISPKTMRRVRKLTGFN